MKMTVKKTYKKQRQRHTDTDKDKDTQTQTKTNTKCFQDPMYVEYFQEWIFFRGEYFSGVIIFQG